MKKKHFKSIVLGSLCSLILSTGVSLQKVHAQVTGGQNAFSYLLLPAGTQNAGLGGILPTMIDKQSEMVRQNPALLQAYHHNDFMVSYSQWASSIKQTNLQYAYRLPRLKTNFSLGLQHLDYGNMNETNENGEVLGHFKAQDFALYMSASRQYLERWTYGATLKWAVSNLGNTTSLAALMDVGINYTSKDTLWQFGLVAKNMGIQLKKYDAHQSSEPLPFDLQIGIAKRLENLPLTIFASAHHLYAWDIRYNNPADKISNIFDDEPEKEPSYFADKLFRHFNFGAQLHIAKRIHLNVGYNHLRRAELGNEVAMGLSGFSFGAQIRLHKFNLGYALVHHSIAGPIHEFGLSLKLSDYFLIGAKTEPWHWKQ